MFGCVFVLAAKAAYKQPVGQRCGRVGVAVEAAQVLLQATDSTNEDIFNSKLNDCLKVGIRDAGAIIMSLTLFDCYMTHDFV
jgi:hypothetical protein